MTVFFLKKVYNHMNKLSLLRFTIFTMLFCFVFQGYSQWKYLGGPDEKSGSHHSITSIYITNCEVFAGTECGLFKSTDGCKTWTRAVEIDSSVTVIAIVRSGNVYFAGTDAGGIYYSDDDGSSWRKTSAFDSTLCMAVNDSFIIAGNSRGLQRCRIDDSVWTWIDTDKIPCGIISIAAKDSVVIAGGYQTGVYRSNNFGNEWKMVSTTGLPSSKVTSLAISGETVFASMPEDGLYCIVNCGLSWSKITRNVSSRYGNIAVIGSSVFVTTEEGIYRTDFFGTTWNSVNRGLENKTIKPLFGSGSTLYAGSEHDGIWYGSVSDFTVPVYKQLKQQLSTRKIDLKMQQNSNEDYHSVINFIVPQSMHVKVVVYDVCGHKISTPVDGLFKEGTYSVPLCTDKCAHGFYMAKMIAGGCVTTAR
jgi:photosystem II stability/assembly factor-like uncharacterized protein